MPDPLCSAPLLGHPPTTSQVVGTPRRPSQYFSGPPRKEALTFGPIRRSAHTFGNPPKSTPTSSSTPLRIVAVTAPANNLVAGKSQLYICDMGPATGCRSPCQLCKNVHSSAFRKVGCQKTRPLEILEQIDKSVYGLEVPGSMKIHNVFHVSLLELYIPNRHLNVSDLPHRTP